MGGAISTSTPYESCTVSSKSVSSRDRNILLWQTQKHLKTLILSLETGRDIEHNNGRKFFWAYVV